MGQKVNPVGFRVGVTHAWGSRWFAPKKMFGAFLVEDQKIRDVCKKRLAEAGISRILVERYANRVRVTLFSARPGVILGRKGGDVEAVRDELEKLTKKEVYLEVKEVQGADADAEADGIYFLSHYFLPFFAGASSVSTTLQWHMRRAIGCAEPRAVGQ